MTTFYELGLNRLVIKATADMGFEETTPIQERTIPLAMEGKNIIGQAQTGTGKTAAFAIPMIEKLDMENHEEKGLVITPTRELAVQVAEEINRIGQYKGIKALPIYGGQDINRQIKSLKKRPQIIVGTPGRLMDHMRRRTLKMQEVTKVVLDEADEMLNMGFIEDIETILKEVPEERQTFLFSATMPKAIQNLARRFIKDPEFIKITPKQMTVPNIEQNYIQVHEKQKFDILCRLLDIQSPELAIVFGRTKRRVDELFEALSKRGYSAEGLHGDLSQARRNTVLRHFKEGVTDILVATDVAARGLDVTGVTHVYNFDIPQDPESYVHRIGRTGRAGKTGLAITFATSREMGHMKLIEQFTKSKMDKKPLPTLSEAVEGQQKIAIDSLLKVVEDGKLDQHKRHAEELLEANDSVTLLSAALKLLTKEVVDAAPVKLTEEAPMRQKKQNNYNDRHGDRRKKTGQKRKYDNQKGNKRGSRSYK